MIFALLQEAVPRGDINVWGILIPSAIFIVAFGMTWLLYRHFAKQQQVHSESSRSGTEESEES